jgi:hypothetical protein
MARRTRVEFDIRKEHITSWLSHLRGVKPYDAESIFLVNILPKMAQTSVGK